jgi:hypothetical protein
VLVKRRDQHEVCRDGDLPPKARQIMVASVMKAHQLLIDNLAAARGSRDDNHSLAGLADGQG